MNRPFEPSISSILLTLPDTLEYTVISNDNFDSAKLLENVVRVELSY